jgi:hypothetical protein
LKGPGSFVFVTICGSSYAIRYCDYDVRYLGNDRLQLAELGRSSIDMDTVEVAFPAIVLSPEYGAPGTSYKTLPRQHVHGGREGDAGSTPLVINPSVKTPCAGDKGLRTEYGATSLALMKQ